MTRKSSHETDAGPTGRLTWRSPALGLLAVASIAGAFALVRAKGIAHPPAPVPGVGHPSRAASFQPALRPSFRIETIAGGGRVVRVAAPGALRVELRADFTGWTPLPMRAGDRGEWELVLAIVPGTYRVSVRIDGEKWRAPSGLAPVADEFNGEVGVVVVR